MYNLEQKHIFRQQCLNLLLEQSWWRYELTAWTHVTWRGIVQFISPNGQFQTLGNINSIEEVRERMMERSEQWASMPAPRIDIPVTSPFGSVSRGPSSIVRGTWIPSTLRPGELVPAETGISLTF